MELGIRFNRRKLAVVGLIVMASALVARSQARDFLIVGDLSGSVKGFATKSPKQIEILYRLLYTSSSRAQFARMPGERDVVQLIPFERIGLFANQKSYTGQRTPLAETIKRATTSYESTVIVTDGMESDNFYLQLQDAIDPLAQAGWGVWILLLPMPFEGKYDLEQPLNMENYEDMMKCVREQNPSWSVKIDPLARQTIEFYGERPLLLFVFDKDPEAGRAHVTSLAKSIGDNLKRDPEAVELSPLYLREYQTERVEPTTLGVNVVVDGNTKRVITDPKDGGVQKRLLFHLAWKRSATQIEQPFIEQWALSRTKRTNWADLRISRETPPNSPGELSLAVSAELSWSEWFWRIFASGPVLREELFEFNIASTFADQPQNGWWNQWNVDTTWRCPHKVFKLKSLVERISGVARQRTINNPPRETTTLKLQIGAS